MSGTYCMYCIWCRSPKRPHHWDSSVRVKGEPAGHLALTGCQEWQYVYPHNLCHPIPPPPPYQCVPPGPPKSIEKLNTHCKPTHVACASLHPRIRSVAVVQRRCWCLLSQRWRGKWKREPAPQLEPGFYLIPCFFSFSPTWERVCGSVCVRRATRRLCGGYQGPCALQIRVFIVEPPFQTGGRGKVGNSPHLESRRSRQSTQHYKYSSLAAACEP